MSLKSILSPFISVFFFFFFLLSLNLIFCHFFKAVVLFLTLCFSQVLVQLVRDSDQQVVLAAKLAQVKFLGATYQTFFLQVERFSVF